jgi:hypothetical protein
MKKKTQNPATENHLSFLIASAKSDTVKNSECVLFEITFFRISTHARSRLRVCMKILLCYTFSNYTTPCSSCTSAIVYTDDHHCKQ